MPQSHRSLTFMFLLAVASPVTAVLAVRPVVLTPNVVTGRVVDERGQPVPGARIQIEPALYSGLITTVTDAQGNYRSVPLSPAANPYTVTAYKEVKYFGQRYCLRMAGDPHPYHDAFNARSGAVRNFVFRIRGESDHPTAYGGGQTWGGSVRFETSAYIRGGLEDRSAQVEVTLVPDGPLIDGSQGKTITRTVSLQEGLEDIPVGRYRVSARLLGDGGVKSPLRVGTQGFEQGLSSSAPLLFRGFTACGHSGTLEETPLWLAR